MKKKYPKIADLLSNDEVLFLISSPYIFEETSRKIPFGYGTTGSLVVARSNIDEYRHYFLSTYHEYKYKICTMQQFKTLYRRYNFGVDGSPLKTGWDLSMDSHMFKKENVLDIDRKILMPENWIKEALGCYNYQQRLTAYESKTTGSSPKKTTASTGLPFENFPDFNYN